MPPTGDGAYDLGMSPDPESDRSPFGTWDDAHSTEPHWPEPKTPHFNLSFLGFLKLALTRNSSLLFMTHASYYLGGN